ncbi:MAG TPA: hypothetical protein VIO11_09940 [Candidatus Methanoperedens sp.]
MSRSKKTIKNESIRIFIEDECGWADFFITRIGLILFASLLLFSAFRVYPMFQEQETAAYLDAIASDISSNIEAVDTTTIPEHKYLYLFDVKNRDVSIEISTEYVVARTNLRKNTMEEREIIRADPLVIRVYPPNSNWSNTSGLREYLSNGIGNGRNGDITAPLDLYLDKGKVEEMFDNIGSELARTPFIPDKNRPLIIEKVIIRYVNQTRTVERDYVLVYQ